MSCGKVNPKRSRVVSRTRGKCANENDDRPCLALRPVLAFTTLLVLPIFKVSGKRASSGDKVEGGKNMNGNCMCGRQRLPHSKQQSEKRQRHPGATQPRPAQSSLA